VSARPRGILFDLDGVFFVGDSAIAGGAETIRWLDAEHVPYLFVTNTTSHPRSHLVDTLERCGISTTPDRILTPAVAAREWLSEHGREPVALFVPDATAAEFGSLERLPRDADGGAAAVVIGDLGEAWTFSEMNRAFRLLMGNPRPALVALGMARYWRDTDGLVLDNGPFVQALAFASGLDPVVTGKPAGTFFELACHRLGTPHRQVVMVGDDIRGDVGGALDAGLQAVLVKTGKYHPSDLRQRIHPDAVLESVADVPAWMSP
jgi:phospholysine phosphohistidine inorganic pyrophosphate phosphatase